MLKRNINYLTGIILTFVFLLMLISGLIQVRFELHRFIYHIYGAYLIIILAVGHVFTNWKKILGFVKKKIHLRKEGVKGLQKGDIQNILSIALVFSLIFTLIFGLLQVKLNFPRTRFVYHIYCAYITLTLAFIHLCLNLKKINIYLKSQSSSILLSGDRKYWRASFKRITILGTGLLIITMIFLVGYLRRDISNDIKRHLSKKGKEMKSKLKEPASIELEVAMEYHQNTKHTYAKIMAASSRLDWSKQPSVFKKYPQAELIKLSTDFDFPSISLREAIEMGHFVGSFSGKSLTQKELSLLLHYTNGITGVLRYPGLTYYLRAAPSAGALYPTVIYLVINTVEGLRRGLYHYSVKDHALYFLKEGDFIEKLASYVNAPSMIKESSVVFIMSTIFYRTKWKYGERGYRYVLLDTGHVGGNLTLMARALGLGSFPIATFIDDEINQMLNIDGSKEAVVYINAVGKIAASKLSFLRPSRPLGAKKEFEEIPKFPKGPSKELLKGLTISEIIHESGKIDNFTGVVEQVYKSIEVSYKSYPKAKKVYLSKEFLKQGLNLEDTIRKRRSARDYSKKPISQLELSRLLYSAYGRIKNNPSKRAVWSIEGLYPIELYIFVNNVEGIASGIYHYNVLEHALELLNEGDYRFRIANACLGQKLVGNANIAIIKTAIFERVKHYGDRGYRYVHLDAGVIGENIYLEAISMGLGVCGIGAFFDDQINEMLGIDGVTEAVIYVTSVGRLS
ncbi:MAG: SagB/ThcOx family dehydrogenase [Omnitrophica bacterium]|nr:SagB/ThcOx family dehydrogenase [Candidatus Omnitrophota bacterium]